ncbi:MAG: alpha/beta hydrolase [Verrucomicrobia bacterium]|nr:alpha/beta hydrolase [Verrucomicrobiota bacterium]
MISKGTLTIENFAFGYTSEGEGPDALVIGSSLYYPRSFSSNLRRHLRLHFVDYRGFAKPLNPNEDRVPSFDRLVDDIETIRKMLSLEKCLVIGHSAHALLALSYAKKYPQHVSHLVMIATSPNLSPTYMAMADEHFKESVWPERKEALAQKLEAFSDEKLLELPPNKRFIQWNINRAPLSWYNFNYDPSPLWEGVIPNMAILDFLYKVALKDLDIARGLERFSLPVFLALGRFDYLIPPPKSWDSLRSKFKDLTVRIFEHSAHSPQQEESSLFDSELLDWLNFSN